MGGNKLGRNDPCWCDSGKKYKKCHLKRQDDEAKPGWKADQEFRAAFSSKKCSVPEAWHGDCSEQIVRAHTVPRSSSLKAIAVDGHVYGYVPSLKSLEKTDGVLEPELIGIKKASTFTGFCSTHDASVFAPLELREFNAEPDQIFALAYRAFSKEAYTKSGAADVAKIIYDLDKGKRVSRQVETQMIAKLNETGVDAGMKDNAHHKEIFDNALLAENYSEARCFALYLNGPPPVMCCGSFFPEQDFEGNQLQDIGDLDSTLDLLSLTAYSDGTKGIIAFAWLGESDACKSFVNSLRNIPEQEITATILRTQFEHLENLQIAPDWWNGLTDDQRSALNKRMSDSANPFAERPAARLADDGMAFDPLPIEGLQVVGALE